MRPLLTERDRLAVSELVEKRASWLTERCLAPSSPGNTAALFREPWADAVALFEDGRPVGCLRLNRQPSLACWDHESNATSLLVSLAHTLPGHKTDLVGRLMTLWAQDFADRLDMKWVRCEVPSGQLSRDGSLPLLDHLRHACRWEFLHSRKGADGQPLALLQLPAQSRPNLSALVRCTVPLQLAISDRVEEPSR
jgi:hypothetical protein